MSLFYVCFRRSFENFGWNELLANKMMRIIGVDWLIRPNIWVPVPGRVLDSKGSKWLSEFTVTLNNPNRKKLCFTTVKYRGKSCSRPTSCILSASFFHSLCLCISHDYYRRTQSISNSNLPHTSWIKRFLQWGWRLHHRLHSCCCYAKESRQTLEMRCCKDTALRGPNINTTTGNTRWILKSVI